MIPHQKWLCKHSRPLLWLTIPPSQLVGSNALGPGGKKSQHKWVPSLHVEEFWGVMSSSLDLFCGVLFVLLFAINIHSRTRMGHVDIRVHFCVCLFANMPRKRISCSRGRSMLTFWGVAEMFLKNSWYFMFPISRACGFKFLLKYYLIFWCLPSCQCEEMVDFNYNSLMTNYGKHMFNHLNILGHFEKEMKYLRGKK